MPVYNKLIRDRIPEIIEKSGRNYNLEVLDENRYASELKKKLQEEVKEYLLTDTNVQALEELADILEVIYCLAQIHGETIQEVEEIRREKAVLRGSFEKRLFLIDVDEK